MGMGECSFCSGPLELIDPAEIEPFVFQERAKCAWCGHIESLGPLEDFSEPHDPPCDWCGKCHSPDSYCMYRPGDR